MRVLKDRLVHTLDLDRLRKQTRIGTILLQSLKSLLFLLAAIRFEKVKGGRT